MLVLTHLSVVVAVATAAATAAAAAVVVVVHVHGVRGGVMRRGGGLVDRGRERRLEGKCGLGKVL